MPPGFFGGKEPYKSINPNEAVAFGAAVQAADLPGVCQVPTSFPSSSTST